MSKFRRTGWLWLWGVGYFALLAGVLYAMDAARSYAVTQMATDESLADWRKWREDVRREQRSPEVVARRVPKSVEPPMLVLLRDHYPVLLGGAIMFSSILYGTLAWLITGAAASTSEQRAELQ